MTAQNGQNDTAQKRDGVNHASWCKLEHNMCKPTYLHLQMLRQDSIHLIDRINVSNVQVVGQDGRTTTTRIGQPPSAAAVLSVEDATDPGSLLVGLGQDRRNDLDTVGGGEGAKCIQRGAAAAI